MRRWATIGSLAAILVFAASAATADTFEVRLVSQTSSTITLGWDPQPGYGYLFSADGQLVSRTNDPARSTVKFAKGSASYEVAVITKGMVGTYPPPAPPPPPPPPPPPAVACNDGVDNDGDGQIDYPADPGCSSATDTDETDPAPPPPPPPTSCDATASPGQNTANALLNSLASGQVGCLHGGVYTASSSNVLDTAHANVTLTSYPGETAVLRGLVIVRSGANGLKLDRLSFNGSGIASNTIQVYADDVVISNSDITNAQNGRSCMYLGDTSVGIADRPLVLNNRFHECGLLANGNQDHAIYAAHVRGGQITGNWFWNIAAYSVHLYPDAQGMLVSRNVIDGGPPSVRGGVIFAGEGTPSSNNIVELNVIAYSTRYNVESYWGGPVGTGNVARNNCVWAGGSGNFSGSGYSQSGNVVADPMFVDRAGRNYNLRPESACVAVVGG